MFADTTRRSPWTRPSAIAATGLLLLAGCTVAPLRVAERSAIGPVAPHQSERMPSPSPARAAEAAATPSLTLRDAIGLALRHNPELEAAYRRYAVLAREGPRVSALPDPRLTYTQFVEGVQTRTGEQRFIAGLSQSVPWPGKRRLRGELAGLEARAALEAYRAGMLELRRDVAATWYQLVWVEAVRDLALEDRATLEQALNVAAALYASGRRGREALLKAQTELARVENELRGYPAEIEEQRQRLRRLLRLDRPFRIDPATRGEPTSPTLEPGRLIARAYAQRPELMQLNWVADQAHARLRLAERDDYPDLTFGANWIGIGGQPRGRPPDEGEDAWNVTLGLTLPIPHAGRRAARRQAEDARAEAEARAQALRDRIAERIHTLTARLATLQAQAVILRESLRPLAEESLAVSRAAYESGRATFLDLLEAERTFIAVRRDLLRIERDRRLARAELERAVGGPLNEYLPESER